MSRWFGPERRQEIALDLGITDRVAMVLGAGGGLGAAIATALAREGARVAACDIDTDALDALVRTTKEDERPIMAVPFDLSDLAALDVGVDNIESQIGPVDILVNITGGPPPSAAAGNSADFWRTYFDAMVTPVSHLTDRVLPQMRKSGWGRIVTSTSSGVVAPIPNLSLSNSLRNALVGWSKTLAGEVAAEGVTVNVVVPGRIETSRVQRLNQARAEREGRTLEDVSDASTAGIPLGRYGQPHEYADVVAFLCSARASYVNGSMVRVDGGMISSI